MTHPTAQQIERLTIALGSFTRRFKVAEAEAASNSAVNPIDVQTLMFVAQNPGCALSDVAHWSGAAMTTMSSAADRLARKGLLNRERIEADRRSIALSVTADGKALVDHHMDAVRNLCRTMLERLDPSEQEEMIRLAVKIAEHET